MTPDVKVLERQALELARKGDFGDEAIRVNREIVTLDPRQENAWSRLGRAHLEQQQFDEAIEALRTALTLNPSSIVATNLLRDVRTRRALRPAAASRATTGFGPRELTLLETLPADEACRALKSRFEALFDTVNQTSIAQRIIDARRRTGAASSTLFHANSFHPADTGHIFAYHYGGRWEPQFNLGWFASPPMPVACFRVGIGFNVTRTGRDPDPDAGQQQALMYFERFQQVLATKWKVALSEWMAGAGGFIQYGDRPPATDLLPHQAVDWLIARHDAAALGWLFCGRWLFMDRAQDAALLADRSKLARVIEDVFRALFPIWLAAYGSPPDSSESTVHS